MSPNVYKSRRQALLKLIDGTGFALIAFDAMQQTNDAPGLFIQDSNFLYLTGINEPGWVLLVAINGKSTLIAPNINRQQQIFDGSLSHKLAKQISGVDEIVVEKTDPLFLGNYLKEKVGLITPKAQPKHYPFSPNPAQKRLHRKAIKAGAEPIDISLHLAKLRAIKDEQEIASIKAAVRLTCESFIEVKKLLPKSSYEFQLAAQHTFNFMNQGRTHAYEPIVAGGVNACTLHYQQNNQPLPKNGLVLMDVGARVNGYAADITRTYAIGKPSEREKAVHNAVVRAHQKIIELIKPGLMVKNYSNEVDEIMKQELRVLGLLNSEGDYRKYYPHAVSHGLGLDVHDSLGAPDKFLPGMVITVEPGIYIPEESIGVRIEDDILITETGSEVLSGMLPTSL